MPITAKQSWDIRQIDITTALLHVRGLNHKMFVEPPREESGRTVLWRLTSASYGFSNFGLFWYLLSDVVLTTLLVLTRSKFKPFLYFKKQPTS